MANDDDQRWLVERKPDVFEDVGAAFVIVKDGCLEFRNTATGPPIYLIAAGEWLTVVPDEG